MSQDIFVPSAGTAAEHEMIAAAAACIERFAGCFNARDARGMDGCLHFPHIILSGETMITWKKPGALPPQFFDELTRQTGWHHSTYQQAQVVLVSPRKVHFLVDYTRDRQDGTSISAHRNLWIVTYEQERWGIKQRSY